MGDPDRIRQLARAVCRAGTPERFMPDDVNEAAVALAALIAAIDNAPSALFGQV